MSATTLAVVEPQSSYTTAEMRARSILSRIDSISAKLKTLEDDIRLLWIDFDNLKQGETILGCATKKEFCEKRLHRTPRAIRYMLAGGNPGNHGPEEIISPVLPESEVSPACKIPREVPEPPSAPRALHPFEELQKHLLRLRPALVDHNGPENQFVQVLEKALTTPVTDDRRELAGIVARMIREVIKELAPVATHLEQEAQ